MATKTMLATQRVRNALLAACALTAVGTAAHAEMVVTGHSGIWSTAQGNAKGSNGCNMFGTLTLGASVAFSVINAETAFRFIAMRNTWQVPQNTKTPMTVQIDGYTAFTGTAMALNNLPTSLALSVNPQVVHEFVHEITSGQTMRVSFGGNEPPWVIPLAGTTALWPQFQTCMNVTAPAVAAQITPTQPFATGPAVPAQPPVAPPTQPFTAI